MFSKIPEKTRSRLLDWILIFTLLFFVSSTSYNYWRDSSIDTFPVVTEMEVKGLSYNNGLWSGEFQGVKQRNCIFLPKKVIALAKNNQNQWKQVPFFFSKDPTPGNSRPVGFQSFDTWNWITNDPLTKEVKIVVSHICRSKGRDISVSTVIGPFKTQ